jgi:signal transduction histidine kinase
MLARLQDAFQQVGHSLEMQRNFVADVSHELRTPLTTLRGNLGLLRRQPPILADEQVDAADLSLLGDRDALKQVLLIGLDNALKHSSGDVAVSAQLNGKQVEIRIHDQGEGILPEKLEHIFDRFYRGEEVVITPSAPLRVLCPRALDSGYRLPRPWSKAWTGRSG